MLQRSEAVNIYSSERFTGYAKVTNREVRIKCSAGEDVHLNNWNEDKLVGGQTYRV